MSRMLTVNEAADYLRVTPYTLRKWLRKGRIRGRKIGRIYRIMEAELEMVLSSSEELTSTAPKRKLRAMDLLGSCADVQFSTADLAKEHQEEIEREEARYREHFAT